MGSVTVFTADRMEQIENKVVVNAELVDGELILTRYDGSILNAGAVIANAVLEVAGEWDESTVYSINAIVTHAGSTWITSAETTAGDEPGVHASWQEFIVTDATPDVTVGDHAINGTLVFLKPPWVPAATHNAAPTNLGDVNTLIANQPLLLDDAYGLVTFEEDIDDIRAVVSENLVRCYKGTSPGIYTPVENTTTDTMLTFLSVGANTYTHYTKLSLMATGEILNNTGADFDITFRFKALNATATVSEVIASSVVTIPYNDPAGSTRRSFIFESFFSIANYAGANGMGVYGTSRLNVGALHGSHGDDLANRTLGHSKSNAVTLDDAAKHFSIDVEMDVADPLAVVQLYYASSTIQPYVSPYA